MWQQWITWSWCRNWMELSWVRPLQGVWASSWLQAAPLPIRLELECFYHSCYCSGPSMFFGVVLFLVQQNVYLLPCTFSNKPCHSAFPQSFMMLGHESPAAMQSWKHFDWPCRGQTAVRMVLNLAFDPGLSQLLDVDCPLLTILLQLGWQAYPWSLYLLHPRSQIAPISSLSPSHLIKHLRHQWQTFAAH